MADAVVAPCPGQQLSRPQLGCIVLSRAGRKDKSRICTLRGPVERTHDEKRRRDRERVRCNRSAYLGWFGFFRNQIVSCLERSPKPSYLPLKQAGSAQRSGASTRNIRHPCFRLTLTVVVPVTIVIIMIALAALAQVPTVQSLAKQYPVSATRDAGASAQAAKHRMLAGPGNAVPAITRLRPKRHGVSPMSQTPPLFVLAAVYDSGGLKCL